MSLPSNRTASPRTALRRARQRSLTAAAAAQPAVVDRLEDRRLMADLSSVFISEFMASNTGGLRDKDGDQSDWIELHNPTDFAVDLGNYALTDDRANLAQWKFPAGATLPAGGYLVVFASGKDLRVAGQELHTNFSLDAAGEDLLLVGPAGTAADVRTAYTPYPEQLDNISYGVAVLENLSTLIGPRAAARARIPAGDIGTAWRGAGAYDDSAWTAGTTGVGYDVPIAPGSTVSGFTLRQVDVTSGGLDASIGNLQEAIDLLDGKNLSNYNFNFTGAQNTPLINHGSGGYYGADRTLPSGAGPSTSPTSDERSNYAMRGTANVVIPAGQWTISVASDDGFRLTIPGVTFLNRYNESTAPVPGAGPDTIGWASGRGNASTHATFTVPAGGLSTTLRLDYYDGSGNDTVELSIAAGHQAAFSAAAFTLLSDGVNGWSVKTQGGAGDVDLSPLIGTDVRAAMRGVNATAYVRVPFNVDEQEGFDRLRLRMKYDDGFVAYVNGVEVARRNAPGTPAWNSAATGTRPDEQAAQFQDITFAVPDGLLREGANVLAIHGLNDSRDGNDFLVLPEMKGIVLTFQDGRYFQTPSPRAENPASSLSDFVADTKFSHDRGFYDQPFFVTITNETAGAQIRYTTDGSAPTATTGTVYTGPVRIGTTTVLRAAAFKPGYIPSNTDTQTYIFLNDVVQQPNNPAGFPAIGAPGVHWDYEMDPQVVNNPAYASTIINDLKSIPSLSLVLPPTALFGDRGIYSNPLGDGVSWERPGSAELIYADGTRNGFQVDAGVRVQGGASRNTTQPKHSFRLLFKSQYGADKLRYPLFADSPHGDSAAEEFDTIILRAGFNKTWTHGSTDQRGWAQYLHNQFNADAHRDMGHVALHGTFVHLYVNGLYWGLYNPVERPSADFMATYFGGEEEDWDVLNSGQVLSGTKAFWDEMHNVANGVVPGGTWTAANPDPNALATPQAYERIKQYLDVESLVDYMILNLYGANQDWDHHNWYASRRRDATGRYRFFSWDTERTLERTYHDATETNWANNPSRLYQQLRANPEFRMLVADRVHKHMFNDGALTPEKNTARYRELLAEIDRAIVPESARWGDWRRPDQPYTRDVEWVAERDRLLNVYFPGRTETVVNQFRADGLYPSTAAPRFNQHGGVIASGFQLQMTNPNTGGTIYYTLDGSDPRLPGGGVAPGALVYSGPVTLSQTTDVTARVLLNGAWSAANRARFTFDLGAIRVTEVMYNPAAAAAGSSFPAGDYEFVEVQNTADRRVLLSGMQLREAVDFTFGNFSLDPGQRAVVVRNLAAFRERYGNGPLVAGTYTGSLADGGETVVLRGPLGHEIVRFTYDDDWYPQTDGGGYSLVAVDPAASNTALSAKTGWRPSNKLHGGPGSSDPGTAPGAVVINEVLTSGAAGQDFVELRNTTGAAVNISGWFIGDADTNLRRFTVPDNTFVPANGYLVFTAATLGFDLPVTGGALFLSSVDPAGNVGGYRESARFDGALPGVPFGEHVKSTGGTDFVALVSPTPGAANSGPLVGPVVISEVMYNPEVAGGSEFIELRNLTGADVPLYDPADPSRRWKFVAGIDFTLPAGAVIPAFGYVIVSQVAPDAFRQLHTVPAGVSVYGPYSTDGTTNLLDNGGENLTLYRPGPGASFILADRLNYDDAAPWPTSPDGDGPSLARVNASAYGNDVANWAAERVGGTPGRSNNDAAAPVADVVDVTPDPRGTAVDALTIVFDEPVTGLDVSDLSLVVDGGTNLLTGAEPLATTDNVTWTLSGLSGLTGGAGTYVLTLTAAGSGVADFAGNLLAADASDSWRFVRQGGATVAGRHVFYNNSAFDGRGADANAADDGAIATDKSALLPDAAPAASNYTSYSRGINGVMVDVAGLAADVSAEDFAFHAGPGGDPAGWGAAPAPQIVRRRPGAGAGGSDRVTLVWADGAILNQWLRVTVKATANTGLAAPDVFYFGNLAGDTGNAAVPAPAPGGGPASTDSVAVVSATDVVLMRNAVRTPGVAPVTSRFDHNRDGRVNLLDMAVTRRHLFAGLRLITEPQPQSAEVLTASAPAGSDAYFASTSPPPTTTRTTAYEPCLLTERQE